MQIQSSPFVDHRLPESAPVFHVATQNEEAGALTIHFDGHYRVGQEIGLEIEDGSYLYRVSANDICADAAGTQSNVARGMLAALVNGGFAAFPRVGPTLMGNQLTLLPVHAAMPPRIDVVCARNLWCN